MTQIILELYNINSNMANRIKQHKQVFVKYSLFAVKKNKFVHKNELFGKKR